MRILVAEDDPLLLDAVSAGLEYQWPDGTVLRAIDGESGLQVFYDHDPDVVLLDVALPELSGFEVLRQIRRVSDVPVLHLSGRTRCGASSWAPTITWSSPSATWPCWPGSRPSCAGPGSPARWSAGSTSSPATSPSTSRAAA